jgi:hypothetical protein
MSKTQERLEDASKAVTGACRSLVKQVQAIIDARANGEELVDYSKLSKHEFNRSYAVLVLFRIDYMTNMLSTDTWRSKSRFFSSKMHLAEHEKTWARCANSLTRKTRNEWFHRKASFFCVVCDTKLRSLFCFIVITYILLFVSNFRPRSTYTAQAAVCRSIHCVFFHARIVQRPSLQALVSVTPSCQNA